MVKSFHDPIDTAHREMKQYFTGKKKKKLMWKYFITWSRKNLNKLYTKMKFGMKLIRDCYYNLFQGTRLLHMKVKFTYLVDEMMKW